MSTRRLMIFADGSVVDGAPSFDGFCGTSARFNDFEPAVFLENARAYATLSSSDHFHPVIGSISGDADVRFGSFRIITKNMSFFGRNTGRGLYVYMISEHAAKRSYKTGVYSTIAAGIVYKMDPTSKDENTADELVKLIAEHAFFVSHTHDKIFSRIYERFSKTFASREVT